MEVDIKLVVVTTNNSSKSWEVIIYLNHVYYFMTTIKSALIDRMSSDEREAFSEFVRVFPLDGHEPVGFQTRPEVIGFVLDNDGTDDNAILSIERQINVRTKEVFRFNIATLLAFAKFGFEKAVELKQ